MASISINQMQKHIRECSLDTLNVSFVKHTKQRMKLRHVSLAMVYEVLQMGKLIEPPEPEIKLPGLRCRMTRFVSGMNVAVVIYVEHPAPDMTVITIFEVNGV